jgi:hypothetical protein
MNPSTDLCINWQLLRYTSISNGLQPPRECIYYHYLPPFVIYFRHNLGTGPVGAGRSLATIGEGHSLDATMEFTPFECLMMINRACY